MTTIANLKVLLSGDSGQLNRTLADVRGRFRGLAGEIGALFGGLAIGSLVRSTVALGDELWTLHQRTQISVEGLSALRVVAQDTGTDLGGVAKAANRLGRAISEAIEKPTSEAASALAELGLDPRALIAMPSEQQFATVIDALAKVREHEDRVRIGTVLMSRGFEALIPMIEESGGKIREQMRKVAESGQTMSTETARKLDDLGDRWQALGRRMQVIAADLISGAWGQVFDVSLGGAAQALDVLGKGLMELHRFVAHLSAAAIALVQGDFALAGRFATGQEALRERAAERAAALGLPTMPTITGMSGSQAEIAAGVQGVWKESERTNLLLEAMLRTRERVPAVAQ